MSAASQPAVGIGVGLDVLDRRELDRLVRRKWFLRYIFTAGELALADGMSDRRRLEFLAGRFSAKEAVLKALQRGLFQGIAPREISIDRTDDGAPRVRFTGRAARLPLPPIALSITHKNDVVAAVAISLPPRAGSERQLPSTDQ